MATAINLTRDSHRVAKLPIEAVCDYAIIDVETMDPAAETMKRLEEEFLAEWEPGGNLKDPEKIAVKKEADLVKFREKAALLDAAPVAMVGVMLEGETFLLHGLKRKKAAWFGKNGQKNRVSIEGCAGEKELMESVAAVVGKKTNAETMIVGHNIYRFDLPKLRLATVRNGLQLPEALRVRLLENDEKQRVLDTMHFYCKYFGRNGEIMISQERMLERLGIEALLKGVANGSDVPGLLAAGKISEVATKLLADLVGVREAFVRMTGRAR